MESIKGLFSVTAIIRNLKDKDVDPLVKIGLSRMFTSLFENTENLIYMTKPKLQLIWEEDSTIRGRTSKFINSGDLEKMEELIEAFFAEDLDPKDPSLHYEFLRFLSYLIRHDFLFASAGTGRDWSRKLRSANEIMFRAFFFCCKYLESLTQSVQITGKDFTIASKKPKDDSEDLPQFTRNSSPTFEADISSARKLLPDFVAYYQQYPMMYLNIYEFLYNKHNPIESTHKDDNEAKVPIQEEICNFFTEINQLSQDVYICLFKSLFKRVYSTSRSSLVPECTRYVLGTFARSRASNVPEVEEMQGYQDLHSMYERYTALSQGGRKSSLSKLLVRQLVSSQKPKLQSAILKAFIGYHLPKTEFVSNLSKLFIIMDKDSAEKFKAFFELMPEMADCLNQLASWLNVSDVKTLRQSSIYLNMWKDKLLKLLALFNESGEEPRRDNNLMILFTKLRAYSWIINFLNLTRKTKLEAAANVLKGDENLGLHAVTFSRELLNVIDLSNLILTVYCKDSLMAKK